jgi:hypothetical protein
MLETNQTLGGAMKTIWIVVISAVVTAGVIGGGTYYLVNAQATKDKDALQAQITTLNTKVADTEKSLADAQTVTSATTQTVTDATAGWKTYSNTTSGYSIKYPTSWTTNNSTAALALINPSAADNYIFSIETITNQSSLDDYVSGIKAEATSEINNGRPGDTFGTQSQTTIGGQPALKFVNCTQGASAYKYDWYFVKKGTVIIKIAATKVVGQGAVIDVNQYIPTAETMISTFQFTK